MTTSHRFLARISAIALALPATALYADETNAPDPTPQEQTIFDAKKDRIVLHQPQWPHSIQDTLDSLANPLEITFPCEDTTIQSVTMRITTTLCGWNKAYVKKNGGEDSSTGHYTWKFDPPVVADGVKTIEFHNCIMLDPAVSGPNENDDFGKIVDETLLYHELLHGQLEIDAMRNDADWQSNVCQCNDPDLTHADWDHETINGLELSYAEALGRLQFGEDAVIEVLNPTPETEAVDDDGSFRLPVPLPDDKDELTFKYYTPTESNVKDLSFEADEDGNVFLVGKLVDPSKPGYVQVQVDPPLHFITTSIEDSVVIHPFGMAIPAVSAWGLSVLVLLIAAAATVVLRRPRRAAARE